MKIYTLDWHNESLKNKTAFVEGKRAHLSREAAELRRIEEEIAFYEQQIEEAKRRGLKFFDPTRLLVKKKGRT